MTQKPDLGFWKLWNLSFGFFGVQIAYALQSSQVSRIFSTIGADPRQLSYFWILPPLMGLIVQPIVGTASDHTWNRFGRRLPYLLVGAAVAIVVMCLLPNAGSLGLTVSSAIMFGLVMLMFLDTSINMAMQPFKMLVGDFVNEKQKGLAYSIQSFLCNAGSVVGYVAPFALAWILPNSAPEGEVPMSVTAAFYLGAAILLLCVFYTMIKVKEMPPAQYAAYHGITEKPGKKEKGDNMFKLLAKAPKVFWTVGIVQFFCWAGFLFMWSYSTDAVAIQAFDAPTMKAVDKVVINGEEYKGNYLFDGDKMVLDKGRHVLEAISIDGEPAISPKLVIVNEKDTMIKDGNIFYDKGVALVQPHEGKLDVTGKKLIVDGRTVDNAYQIATISRYSVINDKSELRIAGIAVLKDGKYILEEDNALPTVKSVDDVKLEYKLILNPATQQYQEAGDWNGILLAVQGLVAVLWAVVLSRFRKRRVAYSLSLLIGAIGFLSIYFLHSKYLLFISYGLAGCGWAAMLAMPFTILTNALSGKNIGTYLGLFNCTICLPQIIAASLGGLILGLFPVVADGASAGAMNTVMMLVMSGILLLLGSIAVWGIKETSGEHAGNA